MKLACELFKFIGVELNDELEEEDNSEEREEEFTEVKSKKKNKKGKKARRVRTAFKGCDESIHQANTRNRYEALNNDDSHKEKKKAETDNRYRAVKTPQINNTCTVAIICNRCGDHCIGGVCKCQNEVSDDELEVETARQEFVKRQRQKGAMFHQDLDELRKEKEEEDLRKVKREEMKNRMNELRIATVTRMKESAAINACGKTIDDERH